MKEQCDCCGTCCRNGGPPLHNQDVQLVRSGILIFDDLVTVRCGELVLPPLATHPEPAVTEWIKIQGVRGDWCCRFLETSSNTCKIYGHRPSSCRNLQCWDTERILAMAGRDLLGRLDLIESGDPLLPLVLLQEENCPVPDMKDIFSLLGEEDERDQILLELTGLVERDLRIRSRAAREYNISVARELFYFGRPLFQLLSPLGIVTTETPQGVKLQFHPR